MVLFPVSRGRYRFHLLFLLSLAYPKIIVFWDAELRELCQMQIEGRALFRLPRVQFADRAAFSTISRQFAHFDLVRPVGCEESVPEQTTRLFEIDPDLTQIPVPHSYLIPYCPHPYHFGITSAEPSENSPRRIRVFFSGNVGFVSNPDLVWHRFQIPSRDSTITYLRRAFPQALWLESLTERAEWQKNHAGQRLVIATCKAPPPHWLSELKNADFFLCLPGSHMPMCHNAIEAMMAGAIPILAYPQFFSPHLRDGVECLTYRSLEELDEVIERALRMDADSVRRMHVHVRNYHHRFLDLKTVARKIFSPKNSHRHQRLYLNQEDCETLSAARTNSVCFKGGTLQMEL